MFEKRGGKLAELERGIGNLTLGQVFALMFFFGMVLFCFLAWYNDLKFGGTKQKTGYDWIGNPTQTKDTKNPVFREMQRRFAKQRK